MSRIRLYFQLATEVVGVDHEGLLILADSFQERQIVIPCNESVLDEFKERLNSHQQQSRVSDVLFRVIKWQTDLSLELVIMNVVNGNYSVILNNTDSLEQVPINGAQAVLLNFISKDKIPVYIDEGLFLKQSSPFDLRASGVPLPINTLPSSMLRQALTKAINSENYELASQLRDELSRRRRTGDSSSNELDS